MRTASEATSRFSAVPAVVRPEMLPKIWEVMR